MFSAHRASVASDTDMPWTSITVVILNAFDSGSCSEQRKESWSLLFVLGSDPGPDPASSIIELGAVSVL